MNRRDRLTARLKQRQEWAEKAAERSDRRLNAADALASQIPLAQPILVGHHSEGHARRDAESIRNNMQKDIAEQKLAQHHAGAALGLALQLEKTIFSDDVNVLNAIEQRIAEYEAKALQMKEVNQAWRKAKGDVAKFAELTDLSITTAQRVADTIAQAYSWEKQPYPASDLASVRAHIRADKERLAQVKLRQARLAAAEASPTGVTIEGTDSVRVTFAEKPAQATIDALKAAGFLWSGGSWYGFRTQLPEGIA